MNPKIKCEQNKVGDKQADWFCSVCQRFIGSMIEYRENNEMRRGYYCYHVWFRLLCISYINAGNAWGE